MKDGKFRAVLETHLGKITGGLGPRGVADAVHSHLKPDYPPGALKWIHDPNVRWEGPTRVALKSVDYANKSRWRASSEPDKVKKFTKKIDNGWEKPVVMMRRPGKDRLTILDGHHRGLAYRELGRDPLAYVAHVPRDNGPWSELHSQQHEKEAVDK